MRKDIGYILAGLGTCLIVLAVLMVAWVDGQVIKWPSNEYESTVLDASNASYFSPGTLTEETGVAVQAVYTFKTVPGKSTSSTAVWNEFNWVHDITSNQPIESTTRTFAFDRKTAELVNCCGANVNGNSSIRQSGIVGYAFPIGTTKQTYQVFDPTLYRPEPFTYDGTAATDGIQTYRFAENVPPTRVGPSPLDSAQDEYYQNHVIYWVDPETGALLDINEHETLTQRNPSTGTVTQVLFDANLTATPASVASLVSKDNTARNKITLLTVTIPVAGGVLGVIALAAGIFLTRRFGHADVETAPASPEPATPAAVPAPEAAAAPPPEAGAPSGSLIPGLDDDPGAPTTTVEFPSADDNPRAPAPPDTP